MLLALLVALSFFLHSGISAQDTEPNLVIDLTPSEKEFLRLHPVITVGNEDDWPPFDFNEHGVPQGYAIDHLELLGGKIGISFEYVNGYTWEELLDLFKKDRIDILPSLWISEERKEYMLFTKPYLELPYVIVTSKSNNSINSMEELRDKIIATPAGYVQEEVIKTSFPEIQRYQVTNPLEGLKAITYGKADAYIGYRGVVDYVIVTNFFTNLKIVGETKVDGLGPQGLHIAVRQELYPLRSILQKAMDSVTRKERVELAQKWISVASNSVSTLTAKEAEFLRENPVLTVDNLQDWPPFNFYEDGKPKGFCVDYMRILEQKLGIEIQFVSGKNWNEYMEMLDSGELDILCDVVETEARRERISFTEPYFTIFSGIVVQKGNEYLDNLDNLKGRSVIVPKGFYYQDVLSKYYPDIQVITEDSILECLKAVDSGKADAALAEKPVSDYLIKKHNLNGLICITVMNSAHFENTPVSIGVNRNQTVLRDIFQKALDEVSKDEISELYDKWFDADNREQQKTRVPLTPEEQNYLQRKKTIDMAVHPDMLPFEGINHKGEYSGIIADIVSLISERIGVPVNIVPTDSWTESLTLLENNRCDLISNIYLEDENRKPPILSNSYFESLSVIVTRNDVQYIPELRVLSGHKVAVTKSNPIIIHINDSFPDIELIQYDDIDSVLKAVSSRNVFAAVGNLQLVSYKIHDQGLYDLKIAGQTQYKDFFRIGIADNASQLLPIINKALDSITNQDVNRITQKWISIRYEHGFNYELFWKILLGVGLVVAVIILWNRQLSRLNRQLKTAHENLAEKSMELERLSQTDRLTDLYNRMKLDDVMKNECSRAHRSGQPLSIIMLDIDKFKNINDKYGHHTGDIVLKQLGHFLKTHCRLIDTVGRWGGEEFLIISPETHLSGAVHYAEKLREGIEQLDFEVHCTCSFGVSAYIAGESEDSFFIRVDQALYNAKAKGRNCVESL